MSRPLILTLEIDAPAQSFYDDLRRRYFPPERNLIPAHLTLFHQLADAEATYLALSEAARGTQAFSLLNGKPRSLGRGVAIFFESGQLSVLHAGLKAAFDDQLIAQDRQRFQAHIVIQNKVDPAVARDTLEQVRMGHFIEPQAIGLAVWRYLGGPWEHLQNFPFAGQAAP